MASNSQLTPEWVLILPVSKNTDFAFYSYTRAILKLCFKITLVATVITMFLSTFSVSSGLRIF
jgi:hypothetical protein